MRRPQSVKEDALRYQISCSGLDVAPHVPYLGLLAVGLPLIGVKANQVFIIKAVIFLIVVLITCRKKDGTLPR